ncbi:hypothetical protein [Candidatus Arsenophonus triatominarum]|uniref:hypothetical protein n=1 Tax=Candidatus Arsenophonus triatominarum TaxID=57911 RepID=UPI0007C47B12|nr:hypothetical protein [Candidatus Arsenophonus triatominarum]
MNNHINNSVSSLNPNYDYNSLTVESNVVSNSFFDKFKTILSNIESNLHHMRNIADKLNSVIEKSLSCIESEFPEASKYTSALKEYSNQIDHVLDFVDDIVHQLDPQSNSHQIMAH